MVSLPVIRWAPLVRTDFAHDEQWSKLTDAVTTSTPEGFLANLQIVDDLDNDGADWQQLLDALPRKPVAFIADTIALTEPGYPILVVDAWDERPHQPFRCTAAALWGVENNLDLFNMDWRDFADCCEADGVFRGTFTPTPMTHDGS